jgi:signal peptidase I
MLSTSAHPFDRILVDKLVYRFRSPARGEVIVFRRPPGWPQEANSHISTDPVLRLLEQVGSFIGLAPTRDSDFVKRVIGVGGDTISCQSDVLSVNGHVLHEPYLYPGSDPCSSDDFDNTTEVVPKGDLFVMGDHRDDSDDSRVYGPVPISDVIGRAIAVIWPIKDWQTLHIPSTFKQAGLAAASSPVTPMTALAATSATLIRRARRRRQSAVSIIRRGRQSNQSRP